MKEFNTAAICIPSKHYMVNIADKVAEIRQLVDAGRYFTINRARQFGKTTTLTALAHDLAPRYIVISISFEGIGDAGFQNEATFVKEFCRLLRREIQKERRISEKTRNQINGLFSRTEEKTGLGDLFDVILEWCDETEFPLVLIIDEIDSATNNQVFLDFLAQLRNGYINRDARGINTFHSVILAGVTDIKHLKSRIRSGDDRKQNSPWNIAYDFKIDLSLSEDGIKGMLDEYEADHHTGMDTAAIAKCIHDYTNGYPFLVSRICQLADTEAAGLKEAWTLRGIDNAVKQLLTENNTLFQSLTKNLSAYPALKAAIRSILMEGTKLAYNPQQDAITEMQMYGLIRNCRNTVRIANRIFETVLYNLFLSDEELQNSVFSREGQLAKNMFVSDGRLNLRLVMERFIITYHEVCGPLVEKFKEKDGREMFLLYLKPIINGTGNYYIEAQTRDQTRTDVIIDYLGEQYVIELKIWRGERYNAAGEKQICEYLDYWRLQTGYMLSFNFCKKKECGVRQVMIGDKLLYEGTV